MGYSYTYYKAEKADIRFALQNMGLYCLVLSVLAALYIATFVYWQHSISTLILHWLLGLGAHSIAMILHALYVVIFRQVEQNYANDLMLRLLPMQGAGGVNITFWIVLAAIAYIIYQTYQFIVA